MSIFRVSALVIVAMYVGDAALADCVPSATSCCADSCRLRCQPQCRTEPITRQCFETECKPVCIPPVRLPCCSLKRLFNKADRDGCVDNGCCNDGLMHKLCSKLTACRIRHVNTYSKKEYECGTKCVCEWKVVCCSEQGCCETGAHCAQ